MIASLVLAITAWPGGVAAAQDVRAFERVSADPVFIAMQLRMAVSLEQAALEHLRRIEPAARLDGAVATMRQAYALIRAAVTGLNEAQRGAKFPDPLLDYQIGRTTEAWHRSRSAVDRSADGLSREEYLASASRDLETVISILKRVLELMP